MISTSSHKNWQSTHYRTYTITEDKGKSVNYEGESYPKLAPSSDIIEKWNNNKGVISDEENNKMYTEEYYNQVLSKLDPEQVYRYLDGSTLLSYEDNTEFSHRHIVASWLEILLDITIPEKKAKEFDIETVERPDYVKEYLEEVMRKDRNMRGFKSLRALYLFEKSEVWEEAANRLEAETGYSYSHYRQQACYLRCNADAAEDEYNQRKLKKTKPSDTK